MAAESMDKKRAGARKVGGRPRKVQSEIKFDFEEVRSESEREARELLPKDREAATAHSEELNEAIAEVTLTSIAQRLSTLEIDIGQNLSSISLQMANEVRLLEDLREAVRLERQELSRLHKMDIAATAIEVLIRDHDFKKREFEQGMTATRLAWEGEQLARERDIKEWEQALKKQRAREAEDFSYQQAQDRKKIQDEFSEKCRRQERDLAESRQTAAKEMAAREGALTEKEAELTRLITEAAYFPEKLRQAAEEAATVAHEDAVAKHKQELGMLRKDFEAELRMAEMSRKSSEETVTRLRAQVETLEQRLDEAKKQVQDIAIRAIEGASGARTLSHVSQIAMEQARPRSPQP